MADFTEEYLKRLTDVENQKVVQLSGIKTALEGSGSGGTGSSCLGVKITTTSGPTGIQSMIANRTPRDVIDALESGKGVSVYECWTDPELEETVYAIVKDWVFVRDEQYILGMTPNGETMTVDLRAESIDDYYTYTNSESQGPSDDEKE